MNRRRFLTGSGALIVVLAMPRWGRTQEVATRIFMHSLMVDCVARGLTPAQCSDEIVAKLGHGPTFKLKADTSDDTVHGAVMIRHSVPPEPHLVRVEFYLADRLPTLGRRSTLKAHPGLPSDAALRARLDSPGNP